MGFYDDIRRELLKTPDASSNAYIQALKDAHVIRAGNVQQYYSMEIVDTQDFRRQLGSMLLPFPHTWIEVQAPRKHRIENAIMKWPPFGYSRAGVHLYATQASNPPEYWRINYTMYYDFPPGFIEIPPGGDFWKYPPIDGYFSLDYEGNAIEDKTAMYKPRYMMSPMLENLLEWSHSIFSDVMLLSLSFMNCKNVVLDEVTPAAPVQTRKQRQLHVMPRAEHVYSNIIIQPLKAVAARNSTAPIGTPGEPAYRQRLHIVRGHFHTYTQDKPLFGRPGMFGKFWIPAHLSGREEQGAVSSTYEIRLPLSVESTGNHRPTRQVQTNASLTRRARARMGK